MPSPDLISSAGLPASTCGRSGSKPRIAATLSPEQPYPEYVGQLHRHGVADECRPDGAWAESEPEPVRKDLYPGRFVRRQGASPIGVHVSPLPHGTVAAGDRLRRLIPAQATVHGYVGVVEVAVTR